MRVEVRLLGDIEARIGGQPVDLGHARQRSVLAILLVEANQPVSVDQLVDRIWGDQPPGRARDTLYGYISHLRRALAAAGNIGVVRQSRGYVCTIEHAAVDLHRFRRLVTQARAAKDDDHALNLFEEAFRLWRGDPFANLDTPWLNAHRVCLEAERRAAELDYHDLKLARGDHGGLLPALSARANAHPLDERLTSQLMLALYRSGRQADSLDHYQQIRQRLAEQLGADPSPALRELHRRILCSDPTLAAPTQPRPAPAHPTLAQLPHDVPGFIGRAPELAKLDNLLTRDDETAVVISAIEGTAGVGKTALAIHFGHRVRERFSDGQLYLDLRGYALTPPMTAGEALGRLLRSLGLPPERVPAEEQEQAAAYRSLLAGKRMLVMLDNARSADQIRSLLPGCPGCLVLITSRTALATLDGVAHINLDVLSEQEALTLLARFAGPDRVAAQPQAATTLVALCARLPLALRIAGARLAARPSWPLHTLVQRLADQQHRLDELRVAERAVRASFAVSLHALQTGSDPADQTAAHMFRLLGVLDWVEMSVQVAAALLDLPQPQAQAALERLVDDHLLDSASPGRYRTHDLLRLYARDLAEHDEPASHRQAALLRALNCYLAAAEQATLLLNPATPRIPADPTRQRRAGLTLSTPADATTWVDTEHTNLIAAAHQAATAPGTAPTLTGPLTTALYRPFETRGYWHDLIALRCLAAGTAQRLDDRPGEALARQDVGYVYTRLGHPDKAVAATQQALAIFQQTCGRRGEQDCLLVLGIAHRQQHRFAEAITRLQQGLAISRGSRDRYAEAVILNNLGLVYQRLHRFDEAIASHRQAYVTNRELNDRYGEAAALVNLGWAYHRAGHADQAITCYQQSLTITRELGHRYDEAEALWGLGQTHHALGQDDKARTYWQQSITVLHDIGELTDDETNTLLHQPVPGTPTIIQQNI